MGVRVRLDGAVRKCAPVSFACLSLRATAFGNVSAYLTSREASNGPHGFMWRKRTPAKRLTVAAVRCGRQLDGSPFFFFSLVNKQILDFCALGGFNSC